MEIPVKGILAADLATNGTLLIGYPTPFSKGSFDLSGPAAFIVGGAKYVQPHDFTVSYAASGMTLTYLGATTLKLGTPFVFGFPRPGKSGNRPSDPPKANLKAMAAMPFLLDLGSPTVAAANNIAASQSVAAGAAFLINGSLLNGVQAILDLPRNVVAAWTTTSVLTITGYDEYNNLMIEKSASGTSHTGKKAFKRISSITSSASITSATVGTGVVLGLPVYVNSVANVLTDMENGIVITPPSRVYLTGQINQTDLLAPTIQDVVCPVAGFVANIRTMVQAAVTTGGTLQVQVAASNVTGCVVTVANAATKGTAQSATPTTARSATTVVVAGSRVSVVPASFATAGAIDYTIEIETLRATGLVTVGDISANSATSGDVRGTYTPFTTPDGTVSYDLIVMLPDPDTLSPAQWIA